MIRLDAEAAAPEDWAGEIPDGAVRLVALDEPVPGNGAGPAGGAVPVGVVVVAVTGAAARVHALWVRPPLRRRGVGRAVLDALRTWLTERGVASAPLWITHEPAGADAEAGHRLLAGHRVLGEFMTRPAPAEPPPLPTGFDYRPMTEEEYEPWLAHHVAGYAEANLTRMGGDPEAALARSRRDFAALLPAGLATENQSIVILTQDGERVGDLWVAHHRDGDQSFGYDLEIEEGRRGEGFGRAAMAVGERLALAAGDTRLGLHVFGDNTVARTLYRSWGFVVSETTYDAMAPGPRP